MHNGNQTNGETSTIQLRSRNEIIGTILASATDIEQDNQDDEAHHIRRLVQVLRNMHGQFILLFAVSNEPRERRRLTHQIAQDLPEQNITEVTLTRTTTSILNVLFAANEEPGPLIVYGIEELLPSLDTEKALRDRTLRELQINRERFGKLHRPLILWMPEYAYTLIGQQAVDFWSWQSGGFFFTKQPAPYKPTAPTSINQLRPPVADFVGRESQIEQIVAALSTKNSETTNMVGIYGMGGIGKTELAYVVANRLTDSFPDGQIVIDMLGSSHNPLTPAQALQTIIRAFKPTERLPDNTITLNAYYRLLLENQRVLILADDANDAAQMRPLIPPPSCGLLVTSRTMLDIPRMHHVKLDTLTPAEAETMLRTLCPHISDHAPELAALCGYLPLALRVSATFLMQQPSRQVTEYMQDLQEQQEHLAGVSLSISYNTLSPDEQQTLDQLGVFAYSFTREAAIAIVRIATEDSEQAESETLARHLATFYHRSLLDYDPMTDRYTIPDLVQTFAITHLEKDLDNERTIRLCHARYYVGIAEHTQGLYETSNVQESLALFDRERPNIDAAWEWVLQQAQSSNTDADIDALLMDFANATNHIGWLRYDLQRERIPRFEAQLAAARRQNHRENESIALGNLGNVYYFLGNAHNAITYYEQCLVIVREIGSRRDEGTILGNLGNAYWSLGNARRAIEYYEQSLSIIQEIDDRHSEGATLGKLGNAYAALGNTHRAIQYYEDALVISRLIGDKCVEEQNLGNLGRTYFYLSDAQRVIEYQEQALAMSQEIGDRRAEELHLNYLGNGYLMKGNAHRAMESYEQQLAIAREIGNRSSEGTALSCIGNAYYFQGDIRRAIEFYQQALDIIREIGNRRREGNALGNLGNAYKDLGDTRRAIDYYEQQLAIALEIGDRHSEGFALGNLGNAYKELGEQDQAIAYYQQALAIDTEIGNQGGIAQHNWNIGLLLQNQGDLSRAAEHMQVAADFYTTIKHADLQKYVDHLAQVQAALAEIVRNP